MGMIMFLFFLSFFNFSIFISCLSIAYQSHKKLNELKLEFMTTTQELKKKVDSLEEVINGRRQFDTPIKPATQIPETQALIMSVPSLSSTISSSTRGQRITQHVPKTSFMDQVDDVPDLIDPVHQLYKADHLNRAKKFSKDDTTHPDIFSKAFIKIKNYFMTGHPLVKIGIVLIFLGISFLLKYAIKHHMLILPIEFRLMGAALFGIGLVQLGFRLRFKSRDYGLVLQGGGIGILILTTFISLKVYALISPIFAFSLLIAFTVVTAILAVYQDSLNLAIFGFLGGFLAPILASTGKGQHVVLFSYYALLNLGILYMSWKKTWPVLNLLGFIFTFVITSIWSVMIYRIDFYGSTQPFLILYFLMYVAIPLFFANKQALTQNETSNQNVHSDAFIILANPIFTLLLQLQLVKDIEYAGAFSALILAGFYIFLSRYLMKYKNFNDPLVSAIFTSIGIIFLTIAIPLAFDGLTTSAIWSLEAAGLYWISIKQNRQFAKIFSIFLIFATSVSFFLGPEVGRSNILFLNTFFFSCLMITAGSYVIGFLSDRHQDKTSKNNHVLSNSMLIMGSLWWIFGGLYDMSRFTSQSLSGGGMGFIPQAFLLNAQLAYLAIGTYLLFYVGKKLGWNRCLYYTHGFVFVLILAFLIGLSQYSHPFEHFGYISWVMAFSVYYYILFFNDKLFDVQNKLYLQLGHVGAFWVLVSVLVSELNGLSNSYIPESSAWSYAAQGIIPIFLSWFIMEKKNLLPQFIQRYYSTYMYLGLFPVMICTWLWLMITNWVSGGSAQPLPYFPLINPIELAHIGGLLIITRWVFKLKNIPAVSKLVKNKTIGIFLGGTYFIWLNGVLCRALHQYVAIPFNFSSLVSSVEVQVSFSLFWTLLGIALMIYATKKMYRWLWVTGATLLGFVVFKMFLIDLSQTETIARIVSFIGVGILFLIVGYFSPIPPKNSDIKEKTHAY